MFSPPAVDKLVAQGVPPRAAQRMIRSDFSVTKEHGQFIEKNGILFMGTFHPAALLRGPQNKPNAFADFVALRDKIHEVCEHTYE